MGFFNSDHNVDERVSSVSSPANADLVVREAAQAFNFSSHLERLSLFVAQTWKNDHPDATAYSEDDINDCILAVPRELAIAAKAVEGPVSLAILTGGGSAAACAVCRQVFSGESD